MNNKGQGILEFLVFLPLFLMFIGLIVGLGNAINGSINQQKAVRGYFYYANQNNSMIPRPDYENRPSASWRAFGMFFIGWYDKIEGNQPLSPCYKIPIPLESNDQSCDANYSDLRTQLIRVGSVYGICGATYYNNGNHIFLVPFIDPAGNAGDNPSVSGPDSCHIR